MASQPPPQRGRRGSSNGRGHTAKPHRVPTHDQPDFHEEKPHPVRSNVTNAPNILLYISAFVICAFSLSFIIVGAIHTEDCLVEPMIPIWLIVMGITGIALAIWGTVVIIRIKKSPFRKVSGLEKIVTGVLLVFFLAWFIAGNVWVYSAYAEDIDFGHLWFENSCDKGTFNLAFAACIALDVMVGLALIGLCIWGVSQFVVRE